MSALNPRVVIETAMGTFAVLLHADRAPLTVANFLAYVDSGRYDGSSIFRIVNPANQEPADPVRISVIHGGTRPLAASNLSMIPLETTQRVDFSIGMARCLWGEMNPIVLKEIFSFVSVISRISTTVEPVSRMEWALLRLVRCTKAWR